MSKEFRGSDLALERLRGIFPRGRYRNPKKGGDKSSAMKEDGARCARKEAESRKLFFFNGSCLLIQKFLIRKHIPTVQNSNPTKNAR